MRCDGELKKGYNREIWKHKIILKDEVVLLGWDR